MITPNKKQYQPLLRRSLGPFDFENTPKNHHYLKENPQSAPTHNKQNVAKDALIEIAQFQLQAPLTTQINHNKDKINSWFSPEKYENKASINKSKKRITAGFVRNSKSAAGTPTTEKLDQDYTFSNDENITIIKLKEALKKLESPQKKRPKSILPKHKKQIQEQSTAEIIEQILQKRKTSNTKVQDLIKLKQCEHTKEVLNSSRSKIFTSYEKKRSGFRVTSNTSNRLIPSFPIQPLELKRTQQLFNIKEARKNRTLKHILQ